MDARQARILLSEYGKCQKLPNLKCYVDERDLRTFYFEIYGLDGDLAGGRYYFTLRVTKPPFPDNPPELRFYTPTGIFIPYRKICISIGEFHSANWRPVLKMVGMAENVMNTLHDFRRGTHGKYNKGDKTESVHGVGILDHITAKGRQHAAATSDYYNRTCPSSGGPACTCPPATFNTGPDCHVRLGLHKIFADIADMVTDAPSGGASSSGASAVP